MVRLTPSKRSQGRRLRDALAALVAVMGLFLIGTLWARELSGQALLDALFGSVYLFIAIGLFGQSRFTLFVAMGVTAGSILLLTKGDSASGTLSQARVLLEALVFICSAGLLYRVKGG